MTSTPSFSTQWRVLQVVWLAVFFSLVPYTLIVQMMAGPSRPGSLGDGLVMPLGLVAAFIVIAVAFLRRTIMKRMAASMDHSEFNVLRTYRAACIFTWIVLESIALLAVVIVFSGASRFMFYVFLGLAVAGFVYFRPRRAEYQQLDELFQA